MDLQTFDTEGLEPVATACKLLANTNRLAILALLVRGDRTVPEIEALTGIRQPSLSQQLGVLREGGLIAATRTPRTVSYGVVPERIGRLLSTLDALLGDRSPGPSPQHGANGSARPVQAAVFARIERDEGA